MASKMLQKFARIAPRRFMSTQGTPDKFEPFVNFRVLKEKVTYSAKEYEHMVLWKRLWFVFFLPAIGFTYANSMYINPEGHDGPEFYPYPYLRRRHLQFPWRDGNKSLLHNSHTNALPEGYEEVEHH